MTTGNNRLSADIVTALESPQESPSVSRKQSSESAAITGLCNHGHGHTCPGSNHPDDPRACPFLWQTPSEPVPGWPQIATLMAVAPDYASFNRFSDLQTRSLLYYQAELEILKGELKEEEWDDYRRGHGAAATYSSRAKYLVSGDSKQWKIMKDIRVLLKEYNEAILLFSQLNALEEPESHNLEKFVGWLLNPNSGNLCIGGNGEENTWGKLYEKKLEKSLLSLFWKMIWSFILPEQPSPTGLDLAATYPKKKGGFSGWIKSSFIPFWASYSSYLRERRRRRKMARVDEENLGDGSTSEGRRARERKDIRDQKKIRNETVDETLTMYSQTSTIRVIRFFSTLVACLLPTIAISVLSQLHETRDLLLCLASFALVFAAGLLFLGSATRVEIFSATAAFSAVLVVFISVPIVIVPPTGAPYVPGS